MVEAPAYGAISRDCLQQDVQVSAGLTKATS